MELADESIESSCFIKDISRCIQIGLLCVQKGTKARPTMPSAVLMLSSENIALPRPQPPGFYIERSTATEDNAFEKEGSISNNDVTITMLGAR